jgi:hypothetical protein
MPPGIGACTVTQRIVPHPSLTEARVGGLQSGGCQLPLQGPDPARGPLKHEGPAGTGADSYPGPRGTHDQHGPVYTREDVHRGAQGGGVGHGQVTCRGGWGVRRGQL